MTVLYVAAAILVFGLLIAIHELGHFMAAKACGVRVEEFAIGMGPAIFKRERGGTVYSLRCVPIGGYCAMMGENEKLDDPDAFTSKEPWKRLIILVAGSFMNFVLGLIIVVILFSDAGGFRAPVIADFREDCPYQGEDALQVGDRFIKIDGKRILQYYDVSDYLAQGGDTHDIVVRRNGKLVKLEDFYFAPVQYPDEAQPRYGFSTGIEAPTFFNTVRYSWNTCMDFSRIVWQSLGMLFEGEADVNDLSGPVGIVNTMTETAQESETVSDGLYSIFYFGAFLAVNLAIMNMLPIPALDGGRVFLLIVTAVIEAVTRKKLNPKYEAYIHGAGMALLLLLMGYIMLHDIINIVV